MPGFLVLASRPHGQVQRAEPPCRRWELVSQARPVCRPAEPACPSPTPRCLFPHPGSSQGDWLGLTPGWKVMADEVPTHC